MRRHILLLLTSALSYTTYSQCNTQNITGDFIISANEELGGTYNVSGTFKVNSGATVNIIPYATNNCGELIVNARRIEIIGQINGNYAGYTGGNGGSGSALVNSTTGDQNALTDCSNKDNPGQITLGGGQRGFQGNGPGYGYPGGNGSVGSGPKQECAGVGDKYGMIGGSGGAGGGGGASYGGSGAFSGTGGNGSDQHTGNGVSISTAYAVLAGIGGMSGDPGMTYGTPDGNDIQIGSGGAGAGGGGRSFHPGTTGARGGNGGGVIVLRATDTLIVSGQLNANGENGQNSQNEGNGGNGDKTTNCCSDGCPDPGERTVSAGAGGGGGAGAGSGGGILLECPKYSVITGTLNANGGNGGNGGNKGQGTRVDYAGGFFCGSAKSVETGNGNDGNQGGAGGGGRIKVFISDCNATLISLQHNENGGTSSVGNADNGTYYITYTQCPTDTIVDNDDDDDDNDDDDNSNLGFLDSPQDFLYNLYPNPTSETIFVKFNTQHAEKGFRLSIIDQTGRTVYNEYFPSISNSVISVPVSFLNSGVYFMQVHNSQSINTKKFIKY